MKIPKTARCAYLYLGGHAVISHSETKPGIPVTTEWAELVPAEKGIPIYIDGRRVDSYEGIWRIFVGHNNVHALSKIKRIDFHLDRSKQFDGVAFLFLADPDKSRGYYWDLPKISISIPGAYDFVVQSGENETYEALKDASRFGDMKLIHAA